MFQVNKVKDVAVRGQITLDLKACMVVVVVESLTFAFERNKVSRSEAEVVPGDLDAVQDYCASSGATIPSSRVVWSTLRQVPHTRNGTPVSRSV